MYSPQEVLTFLQHPANRPLLHSFRDGELTTCHLCGGLTVRKLFLLNQRIMQTTENQGRVYKERGHPSGGEIRQVFLEEVALELGLKGWI